ncbi:hypothetical protein B0H19DRAFT_1269160 [Mycena capillaripes]|nr:hypothetical protein B0H19DRAFT_1269160 [Mycena capillaripes]
MSRKPKLVDSQNKYIQSVYRRQSTKAPTQLAIYELMLADEAAIAEGGAPRSEVAAFLNDGILIQEEQLRLRKLVAQNKKHFMQALSKEIETLRDTIQNSIAEWRKMQISLTPAVQAHLNKQAGCAVEKELLGLPSQLSAEDRLGLKLSALESEEAKLREGAIVDALNSVKLVVQTCVSLKDRKKKNSSGVYKNTISQKQIVDTERRRNLHIAKYMAAREALISLGRADGVEDYPVLEVKDTALKSRSLRRQLGDSQITEGAVWAQGAISVGARAVGVPSTSAAPGPMSASQPTETVMVRRARAAPSVKATTSKARVSAQKPTRKEGWLWSFKVGKMTDEELREWTMEGDKIQWFRAEAEMERWREQVETILADWRTGLRSFAKYKETWTTLAGMQEPQNIGHIAYAKQKAAMFAQRELEGRTLLPKHPTLGVKYGCITDDALDLVGFVKRNREMDQELQDAIFKEHRRDFEVRESALAGKHEGREEVEEDSEDDWLTDNMGDDEDADEYEDEDDEDEEEDEEESPRLG